MRRIEIQNTDKGQSVDVIETQEIKKRYSKEFLDKQINDLSESLNKLQERQDYFLQLRLKLYD